MDDYWLLLITGWLIKFNWINLFGRDLRFKLRIGWKSLIGYLSTGRSHKPILSLIPTNIISYVYKEMPALARTKHPQSWESPVTSLNPSNDSVTGSTFYTIHTRTVDFRLSHFKYFTSVWQNKPVWEQASYSGLKGKHKPFAQYFLTSV